MSKKRKKRMIYNFLYRLFFVLFLGVIILGTYLFYETFYFGEFTKAQTNKTGTNYYRVDDAFCLENVEFNDSLIYKKIDVEKNTAYRITYKVKTENVVGFYNNEEIDDNLCYRYQIGAVAAILNTTESSEAVTGNTDWKEMSFIFYSKNRNEIKLCFRLGGYRGEAKGKAYFKDFKLEKSIKTPDKNWNVVCFNIENVDTTLEGIKYRLSMTEEDKKLVKSNMNSFKNTMEDFSEGKMTVTTNIIDIREPLTAFSYSDENEYYIDPDNVFRLIDKYVKEDKYDHIFIAVRMGDTSKGLDIPVKDWIGLGGMQYRDIGFSNIRMPSNMQSSVMYKYDTRYNVFPEEVFVHEFLHSLERNLKEYDTNFPELHSSEDYGYKDEGTSSIKAWYRDYMRHNIKTEEGTTGLTDIVYSTMPRHNDDFENSMQIKFEVEPRNFFEGIIKIIKDVFTSTKNKINVETEDSNVEIVHFDRRKEE